MPDLVTIIIKVYADRYDDTQPLKQSGESAIPTIA